MTIPHLTVTLGDMRLSELGLRAQLVLTSVEEAAPVAKPKNLTKTVEVNGKAGHFLKVLQDRKIGTRKGAYGAGRTMNSDKRGVGQMLRHLDDVGAIKLSPDGETFSIS